MASTKKRALAKKRCVAADRCSTHTKFTENLWCNDCDDRICIVCFETEHFHHEIDNYNIFKQEQDAEGYSDHLPNDDDYVEAIDGDIEQHEKRIESLKRTISIHEVSILKLQNERKKYRPFGNLALQIMKSSSLSTSTALVKLDPYSAPFSFEETFEDIHNLRKGTQKSSDYRFGDFQMRLELKYEVRDCNTCLGAYLNLSPLGKHAKNWKQNLHFKIILMSYSGGNTEMFEAEKDFNDKDNIHGTGDLVKWGTLLNPEAGWISNRSIRIRVEIILD